jgi:site-specific DNA-methyltransferase (adenine-specific)
MRNVDNKGITVKVVIGDSELYMGDCAEILPSLPKYDACVTDPPYGIAHLWVGGKGHGWGKARDEGVTRNEWDEKPLNKEMLQLLLDSADKTIIWGGNYFDLPPSRCWFVWNKPERNFSLAEAELAWTNFDAVVRVFDGKRSDSNREHPTQKPLNLMEWCISKCRDSKTIIDPFMGSGTTGVAAIQMGHKFIGIEKDKKYFDIACERLEKAHKQVDMFIEKPKLKQVDFLLENPE